MRTHSQTFGACFLVVLGCSGPGSPPAGVEGSSNNENAETKEPTLSERQLIDQTPFDPALAKFDGKPVSDLLLLLRNGTDEKRDYAALSITHVWFGIGSFSMLSGSWGDMARSDRQEVLRAAKEGRISPRARVLVPALVHAMDDPFAEVRSSAAHSLMMIGPEACAARSSLRKHLQDEDERVRLWSARALYFVCLDVPAAMDASTALLRSDSADMRACGAYNLDLMGSDASAAEPFLRELLQDPVEDVRRQARQALDGIRR